MKTPKEIMGPFINAWFDAGDLIDVLDKAGFAIVPKEPTEAMREAAFGAHGATILRRESDAIYSAMIRAALSTTERGGSPQS